MNIPEVLRAFSFPNAYRGASALRQRLQTLEGQALGVLDAVKVKPAYEGDNGLAVAIRQRHDGVDSNSLGFHGLPPAMSSYRPRKPRTARLIRRSPFHGAAVRTEPR